jgi:hypothetical protein
MAAQPRLNSPTRGTAGSSRDAASVAWNAVTMERSGDATRWFDDLHGVGLTTERSAMSLTKSPASNFGSGSSLRAIITMGAAALIGTVVGGVSVLGVVVAVTPPPSNEIRSDAPGGETATPPVQAVTPPPQTAPVAQSQSAPPVEGPRTVWPDALSARANHNAETATETAAPQQASPPANDRAAMNQNDGSGRDPSPANSSAVTSRDSLPIQISPNAAPAKKRVVVSPPGQSTERTVDEAPAGNAPAGNARSETRNSQSQLARRPQRSPDSADQSGDGQAAAVSPPQQRRVIILPGPDRAASDDSGHRGGGLFDFFGQNHSDGDHWNQDHWNNDWHD